MRLYDWTLTFVLGTTSWWTCANGERMDAVVAEAIGCFTVRMHWCHRCREHGAEHWTSGV